MILLKKAIRSMLHHKKAYVSCIFLMALGVWTYATMNTALYEIEKGKNLYYEEQRLGDVFATVAQIPKTALEGLENIDGIRQVDGRIVGTFQVLMPENTTNIPRLKGISTVVGENNKRLNGYVYSGNDLKEGQDILIGEDFYQGYGYEAGDSITLVMNQEAHTFRVQGSVYSPEYVYIVENVNELFSDTTIYNIGYFDETMMMSILGMEGAYNDLSFLLEEGVVFEDVEDTLRDALKSYGLVELYGRDDLFSYLMMEEEIAGGRSMSTTLPMTFISMAGIVLYLMLKRVIEQDRAQIGTLKAFGYKNSMILGHYILYGVITGFLGMLVGIGTSLLSIGPYIQLYLDFYKIPMVPEITNYQYYYTAVFLSLLGGALGAYFGAKKIVELKPVEAMRPVAPKIIKRDIIKQIPFLQWSLNSRGMMAVRNITRNKMRSSFVILGIMFSYSMMAMIGMMNTMMDAMFFNQFNYVMKYDVAIVLKNPVSYNKGVEAAMNMEGVDYAEGILEMPVLLKNTYRQSGGNVIGIRENNQLYRAYDDELKTNKRITKDGIILNRTLANKLQVSKGDYVYMSGPQFDADIAVPVADIVVQSIGTGAYMDLEVLSNLMGTELQVNTLIFNTKDIAPIQEALLYSEDVQKIEDKAKTLEMYRELLGSFDFMLVIMQGIAIAIGFTIIYNTAVISMSERSREYATLRVLGLHLKEVKEIMSFEYWILCGVGVILGIPFTKLLNTALVNAIDIDAFSWPTKISFEAYIIGGIGCVLAVAFANKSTGKAIKNLIWLMC